MGVLRLLLSLFRRCAMRIREETPIAGAGLGIEKYGSDGLLLSSADRGWLGLSAELRRHDRGVIVQACTQPYTELCVDIRGNGSVVRRKAAGIFERTVAERGTIWFHPAGMQEDFVE